MHRIIRFSVTSALLLSLLRVFASSTQNPSMSITTTTPNTIKASKKERKKEKTRKKPTKIEYQSTKSSATLRRIKKEYKDAVQMGICYDWAKKRLVIPTKLVSNEEERNKLVCIGPLTTNLRHWHFSFVGCGVFENGVYHGRILLPKDYPATPPRVSLWTPSGRFVPYADICLSASSYHPESWTPRWTVLTLVQALRLHMLTNPQEIGGIVSTRDEILEYAKKSLSWKQSWKAGRSIVTVDHALLISQGVLSTEDSTLNTSMEPEQDRHDDETMIKINSIDSIPNDEKAKDNPIEDLITTRQDGTKKKRAKHKRKRKRVTDQAEISGALQKKESSQEAIADRKLTYMIFQSPIGASLCFALLLYWVTLILSI